MGSIYAKLNKENLIMYICEHCGKIVEDKNKFGSGRFCCRACANARKHSEETKQKISAGILKETKCWCQFCEKEFDNLTAKASHERLCNQNPDRLTKFLEAKHTKQSKKLDSKYKTRFGEELDITNKEVLEYLEEHPRCEICGKTIDEAVVWNSKNAPKRLCIDHDHKTLKFRGVLCSVCNRQLGWYEVNKDAIEAYLNK